MAQLISSSALALSYPLYAVDFDPQDGNRLVVGGGGGASRTGVGNKISLLDTSSPTEIQLSSEVELSKEEDNVTTLAVGPQKGRSTLVYAGVNSSPADLQKGKNEHFRVFGVDQISKSNAATGPKISELARSTLFGAKDTETYQRLLRITTPYPGSAPVGAVGTGLSKAPQITLFDVPLAGSAGPRTRGTLDIPKDAQDLDIIQTSDEQSQLAYCTEYELFLYNIAKGAAQDPVSVYTIDPDEVPRPSFRAIRYLTPRFILAVLNMPKQGGVILHGIRLPAAGQPQARIGVSAKLPSTVHQATGLAVRNLSPPITPAAKQGDAQFAVAVAGHNLSITLYTLEYYTLGRADAMVNLFPFRTLKEVHPQQVTGMAFSYFTTPRTTSRAQFLKLASVSIGNTVAVHTISLKKLVEKSTTARKGGPPRQPRYVVGLKSTKPTIYSLLLFIGGVVALLAVLLRGSLEITGAVPSRLGASNLVPESWRTPYVPPVTEPRRGFLLDFLERHREGYGTSGEGGSGPRIMLREDDLTAVEGQAPRLQLVIHDEKTDKDAKEWEQLSPKQQARWKRKLKSAGHWAEEHGEGIFKDILFGELAGAVGAAVAGGG